MIRNVLLSSAALAALTTASFAADLPARGRAPAPVIAAPIFTWTGFYVGAQIGGGWTKDSFRESSLAGALIGTGSLNNSGILGGVHAGYNMQSGAFVYGLEADFEATGLKKTTSSEFNAAGALIVAPPTYDYSTKIDWQGSLRGRLGYAFGPTLLYVTGGLAFANVKTAYNNAAGGGATAGAFSFSQTRTGWTLGAGVEYAISNNWSARAEYRYTDFGSFSNTTAAGTTFWSAAVLRHKLQEQSVRVGISYKFGGPAGPVVARY